MKKLIESKYGLLIFSVLSGMGYFTLVMLLIHSIKYSYLLGLFFFPAIVCFCALCVFKTIKSAYENNDFIRVKRFLLIHALLIVISTIIALLFIISR